MITPEIESILARLDVLEKSVARLCHRRLPKDDPARVVPCTEALPVIARLCRASKEQKRRWRWSEHLITPDLDTVRRCVAEKRPLPALHVVLRSVAQNALGTRRKFSAPGAAGAAIDALVASGRLREMPLHDICPGAPRNPLVLVLPGDYGDPVPEAPADEPGGWSIPV